MDNCDSWCRSAKLLLRHVPGIKFNYGTFDITSKLHHSDVFKKVLVEENEKISLFTCAKVTISTLLCFFRKVV